MAENQRPIRNCTLDPSVDHELKFVQQIFAAERIVYPLEVFKRKKKKDGLFDYISLPQLHHSNTESYYYSLCLTKDINDVIHAPVHILIIVDEDTEYEQHLRDKAMKYNYIWKVLMISYDYLKNYRKKIHKKDKKKYLKKGRIKAHQHVFTQILWDLSDRIKTNLKWEKYQTSQSNNKKHGQHQVSYSGMDQETWHMSGMKILQKYCLNMNMKGVYMYFSGISDENKLFGTKLSRERPQGLFDASNVKFAVNTTNYNISIWYSIQFVDNKKRLHLERLGN